MRLHPLGTRPQGFLSALGWLALAVLYSAALGLVVGLFFAFATFGIDSSVAWGSDARFTAGLLGIVMETAAGTFLLLYVARRWGRLLWGVWWLTVVTACLELVSGVAALAGVAGRWRFGGESYFFYDFGEHQWSWGVATCVGALVALAVVAAFTLHENRQADAPRSVDSEIAEIGTDPPGPIEPAESVLDLPAP